MIAYACVNGVAAAMQSVAAIIRAAVIAILAAADASARDLGGRAAMVALLLTAVGASAQEPADSVLLVLRHAAVVDVRDGSVHENRTIVIAGNRIRAVGPAATSDVPAGARVVDARGKYVIPGLWDMHTRNFDLTGGIDYVRQFPLLVANGVTGVREIGASGRPLEELVRLRGEVLSGRLTGPRFIAAGPLVDGPERRHVYSVVPETPERARHVVDSLGAAGADFIKVYANLRPDIYRAIADQANDPGVRVRMALIEDLRPSRC